ncbi:MAG: alpha/beta hydrolase [Burkholderiaceae bacterium]|jgi:pimeloyl-ACP methyl ester carboxylesterase|nr:alpha/beta hydrolase [Burkholderiaceae bacterium]
MSKSARHLQPHDLLGIARLGVAGTAKITELVEALHAAIAGVPTTAPSLPAGGTRGLTGLVYASVRGATQITGLGLDAALGWLAPRLIGQAPSSDARCAAVAALNGVLGDHLAASRNPLAIRMRLRREGRPLALRRDSLTAAFPDASGHVVVLAHGLCMGDRQWLRNGHDHGAALARDLGCSVLYLNYNSGLPIAVNGREFARLLESLAKAWPVPIERLSIVGHSMGGLLARSACLHASRSGHAWLRRLDAMVFLGTPHRGAPLERGGHWFEQLLGVSAYSAPFARLGEIRSSGITDLRHGRIDDRPPIEPDEERRSAPPRSLAIAATLGRRDGDLKDRLLGDGLVTLASALGRATRTERALFPRGARSVQYEAGHLALLERPAVYRQIRDWLALAPG